MSDSSGTRDGAGVQSNTASDVTRDEIIQDLLQHYQPKPSAKPRVLGDTIVTEMELIDALEHRASPAAEQPPTILAATQPAQAIPVWLEVAQQRAHLTQDWQATLCGEQLPARVTWPDHYRRGDCRVCRRLAKERGLTIERQA